MTFAGVSVIGDGGPSTRSTPAAITAAVTHSGYHLLVVDGYSRIKDTTPNGHWVESRPFRVGGHRWRIQYYPNGKYPYSELEDFMSLFVVLERDDDNIAETAKARINFSFVDKAAKQVPSNNIGECQDQEHNFSNESLAWGYSGFRKKKYLEKSAHLKDDCLTIKCDIAVIKDVDFNTAPFVVVPSSDMHQHLSSLLQSTEGSDVTFEIGGEIFAAHRCVLACRSTVFKGMLFGSMKESTTAGVIRIDDMEARVFKLLLGFIYSDSVPEMEGEEDDVMWQHLLVAADRYDLQRLRLMCEDKLCGYINATRVASILELAEQHHCRGLKEACLDFLNFPPNLQQVMAAGGLNHLRSSCPSLLIDLIAKLAYLKPDN